ncbi:uncharacterized protein BDR25DRAFT_258398 [Lindgomyces ingoldianus]|uniref:Uncharacterized protein n=1 Tax=Lindgomyces ingoldianus TaxID=673940 RepID=A0ACB6R0U3_9PLEO|nr:uncharacterized protein BDR25DRAFT_258398 [Lindgomyces ingoldianus]KAF2472893.1 hypothetical protein BDR25DRAFT_258398 [Lindgomyces ingoldianus]
MGRWQPYLYNQQRNSIYDVPEVFNPKAVTMASREPPTSKPKQEGPLVNFNRHPDSYLILPYGKTNAKPMSPKHKVAIKVTRWIQLFLRTINLCGAIGMLLCGIFIRGAQDTEGYIMRIPPGIDIINCLYAIYHLLRAAKGRPPGSSASYHFFALVMDAGLIPFYVFTAMLAIRNYNEEAGTNGRWRTFFPTDEETNKVLHAAWLTATALGGLHCASLFLDLYLVLVFRKIARLPPDMNPLEENLTSRRKRKHKHKNSSISAITPLTEDDKRFSAMSAGTTVVGSRHSQADPLMGEKDLPPPDVSKVPFMHTRTNSDVAYSPHTPSSALQSRHSLYSQPASAHQSRADLHRRQDLYRKDDSDDNETLAQRKSFLAQQAIKRSSRPNSMVSSKQEFYTPPTTADKNGDSDDISLQDNRESLQTDNWFVHGRSVDEPEQDHCNPGKRTMFPSKTQTQGYNAVPMEYDVSDEEFEPPMMPQPLRMNPPTPPPTKTFTSEARSTPQPASLQRTHTTTSISSEATFSRSPTRASTPKTRYYGDLKAATQGIRSGGYSPANSPSASPTKSSFTPNNLPSAVKKYTTNSPSTAKNYASNSPLSLDKKNYASIRRTGETSYTPVKNQSPRVVSRSGVDYEGDYSFDGDTSDLGIPGRRRDVSGKVAEEGRGGVANLASRWGGMRGSGLTYRKVSGVA